jgi:hypothetical protein
MSDTRAVLTEQQVAALSEAARGIREWRDDFAAKMNALGAAWVASFDAAIADAILRSKGKKP